MQNGTHLGCATYLGVCVSVDFWQWGSQTLPKAYRIIPQQEKKDREFIYKWHCLNNRILRTNFIQIGNVFKRKGKTFYLDISWLAWRCYNMRSIDDAGIYTVVFCPQIIYSQVPRYFSLYETFVALHKISYVYQYRLYRVVV